MLSIENPPRDPPCPSQISQLKTSANSSGSDEKASDKLHLVDLFKSDHPLPKFSIRDYVFGTRGKDIKNNWPFSQENLQLCLKHGVTDLLPPFQSSDTVRKPSLASCSCDCILSDEGNISNLNGELSAQNDHGVFMDPDSAGCNPSIAVDCLDTNPSGSEEEKEFPSTVTSQTCSEIDSVPINKSPESETDILPELSVAKPEVLIPAASNKAQVKKCRLVVKLSNVANPSSKEDTSVNNFMVSEAMASKVCPVCKTFSSSSNTTLNAHIDQCLSGESTTKWSSNSKVIKHRIKPRKIKSMVEIYATAPHCTLEELDRRNGTNWATNSIFSAQEIEIGAERKKQGSSTANLEESPNEGAVYIDANGTKVRILSKSSDPSLLSKAVDGPRLKKLVNGDKVSKFLLLKKKKQNHLQKQHKLMKHGKKIFTSQSHRTSEMNDNQNRNFSGEESYEEACVTQLFKAQDQVKLSKPDMIRGWVCSKRTGLTKKFNGKDDNQHSWDCDSRDLSVENNKSSLSNPHVKNGCGRRTANIYQNLLSSPGSSKQTDNASSYERHSEIRELPSLRKRAVIVSAESQSSFNRKRSQVVPGFPDHNIKRSRNVEPPNEEDYVSLVSKRKVKLNGSSDRNVDHPVIDPKKSTGHNTLLTKGRRFSSFRNKLSSGRASVPDSKLNFKRRCSAFKKSRSELNGDAVSVADGEYQEQNPGEDQVRIGRICDTESVDRTGVLTARKSGGEILNSRKEEASALKTSQSASMSYHHDAEDHDGSFMLGSVSASRSDVVESAGKNIQTCEEEFDMEPPSEVAVGAAFMVFRNSVDARFHRLAGSSDAYCDSTQFSEVYKEPPPFEAKAPTCSAEPILGSGQDMFCATEVTENMIRGNIHVVAELGSSGGHGNYFVEVDPIPIPGPPGSFLPSPRHMEAEDLQGNSSLTSSRIQSSDDHQELVDQSSDSPVSATSTISNSTLARSDSKSSGMLLVGHPRVLDGFITAANGDGIVDNSSPVLADTNVGAERISFDELKTNLTTNEKGAFRFKNDQPCCCSWKEGYSQSVSLNYQESQLLRRRTMAAVIVPANGKEMTCDIDRRLDRSRSEMPSVSGHSPGDETAIESPMRHIKRIATDLDVKFPSHDVCESSSPPTSNPVLRLMGKNLMVVNKDENVPSQIKPSQLSSIIGHANPQVLPVSGVSVVNAQNENQRITCHSVSQAPYCFDQTEHSKRMMQHSEWSDGFGSHENTGTPQMSPLVSPAMLSTSRGAVGGLVMHHEYIAGYNLPTEQYQPLNKLGNSITTDADKLVKNLSLRWRNTSTTANAVKEIIVIDDTPENEFDSTTFATHNEGMMQGMGSSSADKSMTMTSTCGSRPATTFYSYPQYESATYCGSPVDASFWMPSPNAVNGGPAKWNRTPEGSSAPHPSSSPSPLTTASSFAAQLRSKLYTFSEFK